MTSGSPYFSLVPSQCAQSKSHSIDPISPIVNDGENHEGNFYRRRDSPGKSGHVDFSYLIINKHSLTDPFNLSHREAFVSLALRTTSTLENLSHEFV